MLAGYFLYAYGGTGQYRAADLLLDPALVEGLSFVDSAVGRGQEGRMVLDGIYLSYFDVQTQRRQERSVSLPEYAAIYRLVQGDLSLLRPEEGVKRAFQGGLPLTLTLRVRPWHQSQSSQGSRIFEELTASAGPGDYYRISLRSPAGGDGYVYFQQPSLKEVLEALAEVW
jgi:hypothetical protein